MKNQYFGDIGDYGKYAMLRFFADNGVRIAINWYLTLDDNSNDGKFISYLNDDRMKNYDPKLFDILKAMVLKNDRSIQLFETKSLIKSAKYYSAKIPSIKEIRKKWHEDGVIACSGANLVFLDPDNGAIIRKTGKNSNKYCFPEEIVEYYNTGKNVVYYCHKGRRTYSKWEEYKGLMKKYLPDCKLMVITFHKGTQRSYIFVLHKEDCDKYLSLVNEFCQRWDKIFTVEGVL